MGSGSRLVVLVALAAFACDRPLDPAPGRLPGAPSDRPSGTLPPPDPDDSPVAPGASQAAKGAATSRPAPAVAASAPASTPQGAAPRERCPPGPPKDGTTCVDPALACTYVDCPGKGETAVHCVRGKTVSETVPCANFSCGGGAECGGSQICVERTNGSHKTECLPNPCGKAAISCECAASLCKGDACSVHGRIVSCGAPCPGCP